FSKTETATKCVQLKPMRLTSSNHGPMLIKALSSTVGSTDGTAFESDTTSKVPKPSVSLQEVPSQPSLPLASRSQSVAG
ncbi:unnamed protein product, partial [Heterosigma akashiwo]